MILNNSVNFGFSRRTRENYKAEIMQKSQLNESSILSPKQNKRGGSFVMKVNEDALNCSTAKEESKDKETVKRRTFSINASSLIPNKLRPRSNRGSFHKANEKSVILDSQTIASYSTAARSRFGLNNI